MIWWLVVPALAVPGDQDDDGVPDSVEDLDGDGDLDEHDSDGDGVPNYLDLDDDGDNVPTFREVCVGNGSPQTCDTDGDGTPDYLDVDDDDDSIPTILEDWLSPGNPRGTNTDRPDPTDALDVFERGDELPDYRDPDDDGDGVPTIAEDRDGDGDPRNDHYDRDVLAAQLPQMPPCAPGITIFCFDDIPDYLDWDDDGDGVPTFAELQFFADPYNVDSDGDGFLDGEEWINSLDITRVPIDEWVSNLPCGDALTDLNGDVELRHTDTSVFPPVVTLVPWSQRSPGDVYVSGFFTQDVDQDGLPDGFDGRSWTHPWDRDCDFEPNVLDIDDDGDGLVSGQLGFGWESAADVECQPGTGFVVGDGIPNYLDLDSDGHAQTVAAGAHPNCPPDPANPTCVQRTDTDENLFDSDGDLVPDAYDCSDRGPQGDDDHDGLSNEVEALFCPALPPSVCPVGHPFHGAHCGANPDSDCDGRLDCEEAGVPCPVDLDSTPVIALQTLPDADGDDVPDIYDPDDDGDGVPTEDELNFSCPAGETAGPETLHLVVDGPTGLAWTYYCEDADGTPTQPVDPQDRNTDAPDSDGDAFPLQPDGVPDYLDPDDDGDGIPTEAEGQGDQDADGTPNYLDHDDFDGPAVDADADGLTNGEEHALGTDAYRLDSDGDGIWDGAEVGDPAAPTDTDGDLVIDALDPDDDGDGIPTAEEGAFDLDGDGLPNYLDDDSDGDGRLDEQESRDADSNGVVDAYEAPVALASPPDPERGCSHASPGFVGKLSWLRR